MMQGGYLSRGTDHLGLIGNKLRDLRGYRTLASEFLQNADDAGATSLSFNVTDQELIVDNDGKFTDCGRVEEDECPWKKEKGYRCDFHRFRYVASGDKRGQRDTIGAFGIGFIAVYQITDQPELISAGRHWKIREDNPENKRIEVCPGCKWCLDKDLPGTRFILPWAYNKESDLRKALRVEPVPSEGPQHFLEELEDFLPLAILFLNHIEVLSLLHNGRLERKFEKIREGNDVIVSDGNPKNDRVWRLFHGDFAEEAEKLKQKHAGRIEDKRSKVTLAISDAPLEKGLLFAYLPTNHDVGLPFHINADFYTTNDRKHIILEQDYQSEWNRTALRAAAQAFGSAVERLPKFLEPERFWALLERVRQVHRQNYGPQGEQVLKEFWQCAREPLERFPVVYTTQEKWVRTTEAYLLLQKEEAKAIPALESLGLEIVNEALRPYQTLLRELKVCVLDVEAIYERFQKLGLTRRLTPEEMPSVLAKKEHREALWSEIALLLKRHPEAREKVRTLALAPGHDGAIWPCKDAYQADEETVSLFAPICPEVAFLVEDKEFEPLRNLCPKFTAREAVGILQKIDLDDLWSQKRLPLDRILQWFEKRSGEVLQDENLKDDLKQIPMFPGGGKLKPLTDLALPGNFQDPLGLAAILDLTAIGGRQDFLRDLGVQELDFFTYATKFLPDALRRDDVPAEKRRKAVHILARRLGELKENHMARDALATVPLVECLDGRFRPARECYFDNHVVKACFGDSMPYALLDDSHKMLLEDLYRWLGVADKPRIEDILKKVREISSNSYNPDSVNQIEKIVSFLGRCFKNEVDEATKQQLEQLKGIAWLPAEGKTDRWYRPDELYAVYQDYLFKSQALFLNLPRQIQNYAHEFLSFLGVKRSPTTEMVVRHLLYCMDRSEAPHQEIYRFLNDKAQDPAIEQLRGKKCLWLDGAYYAPDQVFWQAHGFGRFRKRLASELRHYSEFLERIGVKEHPTWEDAIKVLRDISGEFGSSNKPLDEEALGVVWHCWSKLNEALEDEDDGPVSRAIGKLKSEKCIPNDQNILVQPDWMFVENRPGLAEKFGNFLKNNIILPPQNTRQALVAAGVRLLGDVVRLEVLECKQPVDDLELAKKIRTRLSLFQRVVASAETERVPQTRISRLGALHCQSVTAIKVQYRLQAFNREWASDPEQVPALYVEDNNTLFFTRQNGWYPWPALARELVLALLTEGDPGPLASGFKEVLAAETSEEAQRTLDELGFARLRDIDAQATGSGEAIKTLGEEQPVESSSPPEIAFASDVPRETKADISTDEAIKLILGEDYSPPKTMEEVTDIAWAERGQADKWTHQRCQERRMILRSYVLADESVEEPRPEAIGERRSRVDQAGIERVMAFEREAGRVPELRRHNYPGYDVLSKDENGTPLRYIEVKSLSGDWSSQYVTLSRTQFEKSKELGEKFWLYVVERAESEDYHIYPIPNPAINANRFMFDDGWRDFAETKFKDHEEE